MIRLLFQGDSITDGNRYKDEAQRWDLNHQIGHSYVFTIAGTLGCKWPGKYTVINRGVSGDEIEKLKARWQKDTLEEQPDILSLLVGINGNGNFDGQYPEGVERHLAQFESGYRALLDAVRAQNPEVKIILIEPFFLPVGRSGGGHEDFCPLFARKRAIVSKIAHDFGAIFVPTQERLEKMAEDCAPMLAENGWTGDPRMYWLWDGIHPTEPLHYALAQWWLEAAAEIL